MKKKILSALSIIPMSAILPSAVACSDNRKIDEIIYDSSIRHFVGSNYKGGICSIPHASYDLGQFRQYIYNLVKNMGIQKESIHSDSYGNMWYDIPATDGSKPIAPLVLQAHMDMVWKTEDPNLTHPIPEKVIENGEELIRTVGQKSTLGADNGAGLALMLAITENRNKFQHGPIRCLLSADEEPGMVGAAKLGELTYSETDIKVLDPAEGFNYLLNLDAETEGQIFVSCAGGYSADYSCQGFKTESISGKSVYKLEIVGMLGGHSGLVMDQNPMNGPKACADFMSRISANYIDISTYETLGNVVPTKTTVIFASGEEKGRLSEILQSFRTKLEEQYEWIKEKEGFNISLTELESHDYTKMLSNGDTAALTTLLEELSFGLAENRTEVGQRASANLCPFELHLNDPSKQLDFMVFDRSEDQSFLINEYMQKTLTSFTKAAENFGLDPYVNIKSNYPAYQYKEFDQIRIYVEEIYQKMQIPFTEEHTMGGIECAFWADENKIINQASIGPTIDRAHEITETLHLNTYKNLVNIVLQLIDKMKDIN